MESEQNDDKPFPLSPMQQLFIAAEPNPNRCFDQSFLLKLRAPVLVEDVAVAIETVISRHPMLRARFSHIGDNKWEQRFVNDVPGSFYLTSTDYSSEKEQARHILNCRQRLNIETGPLVSSVLFHSSATPNTSPAPQSLFITIHHLVVDLVSWRVLLEELEILLRHGELLTPPTTSFRSWCRLQAAYVGEGYLNESDDEIDIRPPLLSYWGVDIANNTQGATESISFAIDQKHQGHLG